MFLDDIEKIKDNSVLTATITGVSDVTNLFQLRKALIAHNFTIIELLNSWQGVSSFDFTKLRIEGGTKKTHCDYIERLDVLRSDEEVCNQFFILRLLLNCQDTLARYDERLIFNYLVLRGLTQKPADSVYKDVLFPEYDIKFNDNWLVDSIIEQLNKEFETSKGRKTIYRAKNRIIEKIDYNAAIKKTREEYKIWISTTYIITKSERENDTK